MKTIYKILIALVILGILGGAYGWFFVYNKPHTDYSKVEPIASISAQECYNSYVADNEQSKSWLGKVIQIEGEASEFEMADSLAILVFVFNEDEMFGNTGIRCSFLPEFANDVSILPLPSKIKVKGFVTGYNGSDVNIEQCILIK